jgi:hypothetical protein
MVPKMINRFIQVFFLVLTTRVYEEQNFDKAFELPENNDSYRLRIIIFNQFLEKERKVRQI